MSSKDAKPFVFDNQNGKSYFEEYNNSDDEGDFNRSSRGIL